ncbi:MAG: transposase, partial [Hyphomicrobiales bacterium]
IEAWASMKSFRRRAEEGSREPPADGGASGKQPDGRNGDVDFHGEKRSNATHASTTDPDAMLYRKSPGAGAMLCYMGHVLMENRNGLVVDVEATRVSGHAERMAAVEMVKGVTSASGTRRVTVGADRGFDARDFVEDMRELGATPHVAQNMSGRRSSIDGRTTRHPGYAISIRVRKRIEEVFGWVKAAAGQRKTKFRGLPKVRFAFTFAVAAYNLIRLPKLLAE